MEYEVKSYTCGACGNKVEFNIPVDTHITEWFCKSCNTLNQVEIGSRYVGKHPLHKEG